MRTAALLGRRFVNFRGRFATSLNTYVLCEHGARWHPSLVRGSR